MERLPEKMNQVLHPSGRRGFGVVPRVDKARQAAVGNSCFSCTMATMREAALGVAIFACLAAASLTNLSSYDRLPSRHRQDDTIAVVRLTANLFVVMTSLVLGLMINSAKNTFESIDHNVHAYATELILLDRSIRQYGPKRKMLASRSSPMCNGSSTPLRSARKRRPSPTSCPNSCSMKPATGWHSWRRRPSC
jgi:hypothetical protein